MTGITGKSGQYFLKRLLSESSKLSDYRFKLLCRKPVHGSKNEDGYHLAKKAVESGLLNMEICSVDLKDPVQVGAAFCDPVDMLVHIAGVSMTMDVVPLALEHGVSNVVMVHTTGIYSKYKAAGEEYRKIEAKIAALIESSRAQGKHIAATILRPTMIYGDLNDGNVSVFIGMVDKFRLFPTVNGAKYDLQPVWCKDLGDAYFDVMMNWDVTQNKEYILSGGAPIRLREMFCEIARQLGVKNTFVTCPYPIAYAGAWAVYLLSLTKVDLREKVQRLIEPRAYGHEAAAKDFGYNPAEFAIGVRDEINMYQLRKRKKM